jgi:regulator of cell morphogenesis and NO signaling
MKFNSKITIFANQKFTQMNYALFSENTKMADVILANSRLLYVLPSFGLNLGFGEKTVKQVCAENNLPVPLFLLVSNIYTFDDYSPGSRDLMQIPIDGIIRYLQNSHKDYQEVRMPQIIDSILDLSTLCHLRNGNILKSFCEKYREEVIAHFKYEEEIAFPYIIQLLNGVKSNAYKIEEYESNHSNIDAALNDLKNIIIKYLPRDCAIKKCRDTLLNLFMFEHDLSKHSMLEDKILISLVEHVEKDHETA